MIKIQPDDPNIETLPKDAASLLDVRGAKIIEQLGPEIVKEVIYNVLCGHNLRDSTEKLTKRRLDKLNAYIFTTLLIKAQENKNFIRQLPIIAKERLKITKSKKERWFYEWVLGLTDKGFQNILRDKKSKLDVYVENYLNDLNKIIEWCNSEFGPVKGNIQISSHKGTSIDWRFLIQLFGIIGSKTLAIRGSEKSTYGKLYEKLILGSLLTILGFKYVPKKEIVNQKTLDKIFWLSERLDKRESDATALLTMGKGIRFDIGFIGRGNPEISLDKVSRFEKEIILGRKKWYLATFIIVDRIGIKSRIESQAKEINGKIIQMSMSYWPKQVAIELHREFGYRSKLVDCSDEKFEKFVRDELKKQDFSVFLK